MKNAMVAIETQAQLLKLQLTKAEGHRIALFKDLSERYHLDEDDRINQEDGLISRNKKA